MKYVYLCGPVTGRPEEESFRHFAQAEQKISRMSKENKLRIYVSNPKRFCPPGSKWHTAMRLCAGALSRCDGIALLRGWQGSKGAALELKLADDLHIPVVYIEPEDEAEYLPQILAAFPETARYYNARMMQFQKEGAEESLAAGRAAAELFNRYLDPHGFEYINEEEK